MADATKQADTLGADQKGERKTRVPQPPILRLSEAFVLAKRINEAGGSASYDLFSQMTGNTKTSSSFQRRVSALRMYGIVADTENVVELSDLGNRMAHPTSSVDDLLALKDAMLKIDTLAKIFERHRGRLLPEDQFLVNILIQELKIEKEVAPRWVEWFKDALATAQLVHVRTDGKTQVLEAPTGVSTGGSESGNSAAGKSNPPPPLPPPAQPNVYEIDEDFAIPIVLGRGRIAKVELPSDWNAKKDLSRFLKMLKLALSEGDEGLEKEEP